MIVPAFWAEAKERVRVNGRPKTYKRFGWSDVSDEDAMANARDRLADAVRRAQRGEKVRFVDRKVPYNGADGLPIREEIISRRDDMVITRNAYGAACLNTPDVLFADVDLERRSHWPYGMAVFVLIVAAGYVANKLLGTDLYFLLFLVGGLVLSSPIGRLIMLGLDYLRSSPVERALRRIEATVKANPRWILRVYRTPNGFRVLAMHDTFDPRGQKTHDFMKAIGTDPVYMQMCLKQKCFRARLSPKPWRIGIQEHLKPRPGVWPIAEERLPDRRRWVRMYEKLSAGFAACRYETTFGKGRTARKCEDVKRLHDDLCRATSELPIA
ncbi:MAG: hypothetical protein AAF660_11790 [Pseudomonadota bacterium]